MNNAEKVIYWREISDYDLETAKAMLTGKRYLYVGFMCHQSVEKILKAYFSAKKEETPPYVHNLKRLAEECLLMTQFSEEQLDLIEELIPMNIEARYPTHKELLFKSLTVERCKQLILKTEELCFWIKQQL
jgi:HEPN domain-containing protein